MGRLFEYTCKCCGYIVVGNPKGYDVIMSGEVIECLECGGH